MAATSAQESFPSVDLGYLFIKNVPGDCLSALEGTSGQVGGWGTFVNSWMNPYNASQLTPFLGVKTAHIMAKPLQTMR